MDTPEANRIAVGGFTHAVRRALKSLGMRRCSARLVQYQFKPDALRLDWYGLFWRWFRALWIARREGAEFLFEDFCARVEALRGAEAPRAPRDWRAQVAACALAHGEALAAAAERRDPVAIRRAVAAAIAEQRELLSLLDRGAVVEADVRRAA